MTSNSGEPSSDAPKELQEVNGEVVLPKYMYLENVTTGSAFKRGSYGVVSEATWRGLPCVVKEIHYDLNVSDTHLQQQARELGDTASNAVSNPLEHFKREAWQWAVKLRHPNVVQFLGLLEQDGCPAIVMERLHQDLHDFLTRHKSLKKDFPAVILRSFAIDVCRAFAYLEGIGVMHRDLKGNNVLLTSHLVAKVSDFGAARVHENSERGKFTKAPGNSSYAAPEAFRTGYGPKVDVFSFGCLLIEILIFSLPQPRAQDKDESNRITEYDRRKHLLPSAAEDTPALYEDFQPLIRQCLENNPDARPTFDRLLQMLSVKDHIRDDDRYRVINANLVTLAEKYSTEDANPKWDDFDDQKFSTSDDEQLEKKDLQKTSTSSASEPFESRCALSLNHVLFAVIILLFSVIVYQHFI